MYVLDGQQRLTSISRALLGEDPKYLYYFDLSLMYEELVAGTGSDLDWVRFTPRTKKSKTLQSHQMPCEAVLSAATSGAKVHTYLNEAMQVPVERLFDVATKITSVFEVIRNYQVVSHLLEKKESLEAICRIFETINNTGVKLDTFDLVVAKNYSADFDLRELVETSEAAVPDCAKLAPDSEMYLHSLNYYLQHQAGKRFDLTRAGLLELPREALSRHLQLAITAYGAVYRWLEAEKFRIKRGRPTVPNMVLSIIAAAEMAYPGALEKNAVRAILTRWVLATLWEDSAYNKTSALPDLPKLMELFSAQSPSHSILPLPASLKPVSVEELIETNMSSKKYGIAHTIMRRGRDVDLLGEKSRSIDELEDHHIFPKSVALKRGFDKDLVNCIGNRVLVSANTNKKIAYDYLPKDYFEAAKNFVDAYTLSKTFELDYISVAMLDEASNVFTNEAFRNWMSPRLEAIADEINGYFGFSR